MIGNLKKFFDGASRLSATLRDAAVASFYPGDCRVCGEMIESWRDGAACLKCWQDIERKSLGVDFCVKCWTRLRPQGPGIGAPDWREDRRPQDWHEDRWCGRCESFAFDFVRSCGPYEGALRETVLRLKHRPHIPARLRDGLRRAFDSLPGAELTESIIPVPLHPERISERRFNQAEVIARELASLTGLRLNLTAVIRVKKTEKHRAGMGQKERARSLEKAFWVRAPRLIEGRVALLVDDVITTGSTADEIARVLIEGGAKTVNVLTLARAMNEFSN